jgi:hypothetical protein
MLCDGIDPVGAGPDIADLTSDEKPLDESRFAKPVDQIVAEASGPGKPRDAVIDPGLRDPAGCSPPSGRAPLVNNDVLRSGLIKRGRNSQSGEPGADHTELNLLRSTQRRPVLFKLNRFVIFSSWILARTMARRYPARLPREGSVRRSKKYSGRGCRRQPVTPRPGACKQTCD